MPGSCECVLSGFIVSMRLLGCCEWMSVSCYVVTKVSFLLCGCLSVFLSILLCGCWGIGKRLLGFSKVAFNMFLCGC